VAPLAAGRFALQFSVGESTLDDLASAWDLGQPPDPVRDLAEVFGRALKAYIRELEKTKIAATPDGARSCGSAPGNRSNPRIAE